VTKTIETIKDYKTSDKKKIDFDIFNMTPHQHPRSKEMFRIAIIEEDMDGLK